MALIFIKWNSNTTDENVFKEVVLGGMDSDLVPVLRVAASPLPWGSDQIWVSQPLSAPSFVQVPTASKISGSGQTPSGISNCATLLPPHPQANAIPAFGLAQ